MVRGRIPSGGDILVATMTPTVAKERARSLLGCSGFTYKGDIGTDEEVEVFFKSQWGLSQDGPSGWTAVYYDRSKDVGDRAEKVISAPSPAQLKMTMLAAALPFVGFGFLDNFIMIIFGELIDSTLCVTFSLSTMAAAAIGNTVSDVAGIFSGGAVEHLAIKMGYGEPKMDEKQRELPITKFWQYSGQVIGIVTGCILGCCPLLWIESKAGELLKRDKEKEEIFKTVTHKVRHILHAEAAALLLLDRDRRFLRTRCTTENLPPLMFEANSGFVGTVVRTGHFVNIADVSDEKLDNTTFLDAFNGTGITVSGVLCMPIYREGEVKGAMLLINKQVESTFTPQDEDVLSAICSHISVELGDSRATFDEVIETCEKSMKKIGSQEWGLSSISQRRIVLYVPALEGIRQVVDAESAALLLYNREAGVLETEVIDGPLLPHKIPVGSGAAGKAVIRGQTVNAPAGSRLLTDAQFFKPMGKREADEPVQGEAVPLELRSELAVPLFNTCRKCLGVIRCINKNKAAAFTVDDVRYVAEVAMHIEIMLEGPDAGLRRVLSLSRRQMQRTSSQNPEIPGQAYKVLTKLLWAENLPVPEDLPDQKMDPYVTFTVTRGDPIVNQEPGLAMRVWKARNQDRHQAARRWAKSQTLLEDCNAHWDESINVYLDPHVEGVPIKDLYLHVLLWDYDALEQDSLIAQAAVPLESMPSSSLSDPYCLELRPIAGQEGKYSLEGSRLWISYVFSTRPQPGAAS